jgi:hypothetical protein
VRATAAAGPFGTSQRPPVDGAERRELMRRPADQKRDRMIGVLVNDEEYERIRTLAFEARKSLGAYVRDRILGGESKKPKSATR